MSDQKESPVLFSLKDVDFDVVKPEADATGL